MKKNTVKLFILAAMLGGSLSAQAQSRAAKAEVSEAAAKRLKNLSEELTAQYNADYAEAVKYAKEKNIPLTIKKDGGISVLTKVKDGELYYTATNNVGSALTSRTNHLQPGGSLGLNLTGEFEDGTFMLAGVWDGGYARPTHNDLSGRLETQGDFDLDVALHPTHVTGTIIGNGASASDSKGMAIKAHAINYSYNGDEGEMPTFALLGGILSNHSYGLDQSQFSEPALVQIRGTYSSYARAVDRITFDAPYYQPVFAAGNDGDGTYDRLTDRSMSKNGIAVTAIAQVNTYIDETSVQPASFTSYGPTNDNRIKPDISSKGLAVFSCSDTGNSAHVYEQGTSMAAPGITGALVLLQQYYSILHPSDNPESRNFMKSSTVRALVAHSADEAGFAPGPDPIFGWGLMNSKRAAEILAADKQNTSAKIQEKILLPGETFTYTVNASGAEPLRATLAWTDPAAPSAADGSSAVTLINNLDIKVTKGTTVYYPWRLASDGSNIAVNDGDNNVDNIEKVEVPGATGAYTITVKHKKTTLVNPNGSPEQAYSLIISGITSAPLGLEDMQNKMFAVWPNPANDVLNISVADGAEKGASAAFYDVQGRLVKSANLTGVDNTVNVQDLAKGLYMVSITNGAKTEVEKIIIK